MSDELTDPAAEHRHRVMNTLAALLANAQFLESTLAGESGDEPILADESPAARRDVLLSIRHIVQSAHDLTTLLKR